MESLLDQNYQILFEMMVDLEVVFVALVLQVFWIQRIIGGQTLKSVIVIFSVSILGILRKWSISYLFGPSGWVNPPNSPQDPFSPFQLWICWFFQTDCKSLKAAVKSLLLLYQDKQTEIEFRNMTWKQTKLLQEFHFRWLQI